MLAYFILKIYLKKPEEGSDTTNIKNVSANTHNMIQDTDQLSK